LLSPVFTISWIELSDMISFLTMHYHSTTPVNHWRGSLFWELRAQEKMDVQRNSDIPPINPYSTKRWGLFFS